VSAPGCKFKLMVENGLPSAVGVGDTGCPVEIKSSGTEERLSRAGKSSAGDVASAAGEVDAALTAVEPSAAGGAGLTSSDAVGSTIAAGGGLNTWLSTGDSSTDSGGVSEGVSAALSASGAGPASDAAGTASVQLAAWEGSVKDGASMPASGVRDAGWAGVMRVRLHWPRMPCRKQR
jgi:hypothetical protein